MKVGGVCSVKIYEEKHVNYRERSDLVQVNIFVGELDIWRKSQKETR